MLFLFVHWSIYIYIMKFIPFLSRNISKKFSKLYFEHKFQRVFLVIFPVPPNIDDALSSTDVIVREGANVTLTCIATGSPQPSVRWKRDDGNRININKTHSGAFTLSRRSDLAFDSCSRSMIGSSGRVRRRSVGFDAHQPPWHGRLPVHRLQRCSTHSQQEDQSQRRLWVHQRLYCSQKPKINYWGSNNALKNQNH